MQWFRSESFYDITVFPLMPGSYLVFLLRTIKNHSPTHAPNLGELKWPPSDSPKNHWWQLHVLHSHEDIQKDI